MKISHKNINRKLENNNISSVVPHKKKITDIDKAFSFKNVSNPEAYRNPFMLEKAISSLFKDVDNAYVLRFGDIRVWFKSVESAETALHVETKKTVWWIFLNQKSKLY